MRDDCGVPSWRPCCETGASARLCGGRWGAGSCWHLHIFSVGHVWEIDRYPAIAGRIGSARFFNEHLAVNIVCCPVLIPEHMGAPFALLRASPIIGLAPFTFCPGKRRKRLKTQGLIRSEERRVGKECVLTCRSRWSPYP